MAQRHNALTTSDDLAQPAGAIEMLQADHRQVRRLVQQYDATHDQATKRQIAEHVFANLERHAHLEETVFYPAFAAQAGDEGDRLVGGARQEHQLFKDLMAELRDIDDDDEFAGRFHELMAHVERHVEDEEREIFPQAEVHLRDHMTQITEAMQELKHQVSVSSTAGL